MVTKPTAARGKTTTKNKINSNPDAVQSTKKLKEESDVKKLEKFTAGLAGLAPNQLDGKLRRLLKSIKGPKTKNPNPDTIKSTKKLKEESDIKRLSKFTKPPVKGPEGPKKPTLRGRFLAEGKAPVEKKKGGEVKKKSKKSGKLALRGYGKSR